MFESRSKRCVRTVKSISGRGAGGPRGRGASGTDGALGGRKGGLSLAAAVVALGCDCRGEREARAGLRAQAEDDDAA